MLIVGLVVFFVQLIHLELEHLLQIMALLIQHQQEDLIIL